MDGSVLDSLDCNHSTKVVTIFSWAYSSAKTLSPPSPPGHFAGWVHSQTGCLGLSDRLDPGEPPKPFIPGVGFRCGMFSWEGNVLPTAPSCINGHQPLHSAVNCLSLSRYDNTSAYELRANMPTAVYCMFCEYRLKPNRCLRPVSYVYRHRYQHLYNAGTWVDSGITTYYGCECLHAAKHFSPFTPPPPPANPSPIAKQSATEQKGIKKRGGGRSWYLVPIE